MTAARQLLYVRVYRYRASESHPQSAYQVRATRDRKLRGYSQHGLTVRCPDYLSETPQQNLCWLFCRSRLHSAGWLLHRCLQPSVARAPPGPRSCRHSISFSPGRSATARQALALWPDNEQATQTPSYHACFESPCRSDTPTHLCAG